MSADPQVIPALGIVGAVRTAFPLEASSIDTALRHDGFELADAPHIWLERFSQLTTDALKQGEFARAAEHLRLISGLLDAGDEPTARCIDVAYVESLMWDIDDDELKRQGWKVIPGNLRSLYIAMWGNRSLTEDVV